MLLRVNHPTFAEALAKSLRERVGIVVGRIGPSEVAVGALGSYEDGGRREIESFLRTWVDDYPDAHVEVLPFRDDRVRALPRRAA